VSAAMRPPLPMALRLPRLSSNDPDRRLKLAVGFSALVHAAILSVQFGFPILPRIFHDKPLEVVLVNSKTKERPRDAQALAQANLDGGGNTDENRRAKTPLPASKRQKEGTQLDEAQQRVRELEVRQRTLMANVKSPVPAIPAQPPKEAQPDAPAELTGVDLAANALAMARLQAQIERDMDAYNKRPKKKFVGARVEEYRFAQYVEDWRLKVERIGTLNYPEAARGKVYGSLLLTVILLPDGSVSRIEVDRSSGHRVLDDAARRIVQMASPYAAFPPDIRRDTDELAITRTWYFTRDEQVHAN
jgi:periplasmic protein TonB